MELSPNTKHRLTHQHNQIDSLVKDLPVHFIQKRHIPEKWSILENLAHLGRYQEIFLDRIRRVLSEEEPHFGRYVAEQDAEFESWLNLELEITLSKIREDRVEIIELISSLDEVQFNRKGVHPKFGRMNILEWTEFFLLHESHHFYTIFRLIQQFK